MNSPFRRPAPRIVYWVESGGICYGPYNTLEEALPKKADLTESAKIPTILLIRKVPPL